MKLSSIKVNKTRSMVFDSLHADGRGEANWFVILCSFSKATKLNSRNIYTSRLFIIVHLSLSLSRSLSLSIYIYICMSIVLGGMEAVRIFITSHCLSSSCHFVGTLLTEPYFRCIMCSVRLSRISEPLSCLVERTRCIIDLAIGK